MEKRRIFALSLLLMCCITHMQAQWDASFSHYWAARNYFNPAFAGETKEIETSALYRYQWTGIENAPRSVLLTADMPVEFFNRRHGVGVVAYSQNIGTLRNTLMGGQYNLIQSAGSGYWHFGLQASLYDIQFDAGNLQVVTDSLQIQRGSMSVNPVEKKLFVLNAGISWRSKKGFAGLSSMHINQPQFYIHNDSIDLQTDSLRSFIPRSYHFMSGYNIALFHPLELQPMVWVAYTSDKVRVQTTLRMEYNKKFSGGLSWRMNDGYVFFAGTTFQGVEMEYAYDLHKEGMGKVSKGSHEVSLRYLIPADYLKPKRQPHKSIRLL